MELRLECFLPCSVRGPVGSCALQRFAATFFGEMGLWSVLSTVFSGWLVGSRFLPPFSRRKSYARRMTCSRTSGLVPGNQHRGDLRTSDLFS